MKVLKILQSSKAPLIKKRQAMRNTFGDYRAKMKKEQTKSAAGKFILHVYCKILEIETKQTAKVTFK